VGVEEKGWPLLSQSHERRREASGNASARVRWCGGVVVGGWLRRRGLVAVASRRWWWWVWGRVCRVVSRVVRSGIEIRRIIDGAMNSIIHSLQNN
jgi:hypothetical protein